MNNNLETQSNASVATETAEDGGAARDELVLQVLSAVDRDSNTSQRTISRELGVALGLANAYLRRCVRKGWIKIQQVPRRRYVYYLTPQGFAEKSRLTTEYLSASFNFFRLARVQISELIGECAAKGWRRIAFAGASELAEIGVLCAYDFDVTLVGIVDEQKNGSTFAKLPVRGRLADLGPVDAVIITSLSEADRLMHDIGGVIARERVLAPRLLRLRQPVDGPAT
jgi:DNA-binding MarR family transcriptional regulator